MVKLLEIPMQEFTQNEAELLKGYDLLDEQGNTKQNGDSEKVAQFRVEQNRLYQECAQIGSGAYVPQIEKLQNILKNIEIELSGESTAAYLMK